LIEDRFGHKLKQSITQWNYWWFSRNTALSDR